MLRSLVAIVAITGCTVAIQGQIINHDNVDAVASLVQSTMDAVGQQKWLFTHASVGGNMIDGMNSLHAADPTRYPLVTVQTGDDGSRAEAPPSSTVAGTIYDCNRGNPGWQTKITFLDDSVRIAGWHDPAVTVVLNKMCYIDQDADALVYLDSMAALETSYPGTTFVYMTIPLTTSTDSENIVRNQYNAAVRSFCSSHGTLLFDIADMEAHDPAGTEYTFTSGGQTYQRMYPGYSSDGGHLNATGSQRIALGWYATATTLAVPASDNSADPDNPSPPPNPAPSRGLCGLGATGAITMMMLGLIGLKFQLGSRGYRPQRPS